MKIKNLKENQILKFKPFTDEDIPKWREWVKKPHVKDVWFIEGYMTVDEILSSAKNEVFNYPYTIIFDDTPVGYILACDLHAYSIQTENPKGLFTHENPGTFCMDLFIGEEDYLNKGYGTKIISAFIELLFDKQNALKILINPAVTNKRAIRCYEKAGFTAVRTEHDGVTESLIMEINKND